MMKKVFALIISLLMLFAFSACSSNVDLKDDIFDEALSSAEDFLSKYESDNKQEENKNTDTSGEKQSEDLPDESSEKDTPVGIREDFKKAMDAYEAFYDEYCDFLKEMKENPSDPKLILEYAQMLTKVEEMDKAFEEWDEEELSNEELMYYMDVHNRVMKKLIDVSQ